MTTETLNLCKKVNADLQIERFNTRMCYISRIFDYDKHLGVDQKILKRNKYYYNDGFDQLMELTLEQLEEVDQQISEAVRAFNIIKHNLYGKEKR